MACTLFIFSKLTIFLLFASVLENAVGHNGTFIYLGDFANRSGRSISYYVSDYELGHTAALLECDRVLSGRSLTIMTFEQDDFIRLKLQFLELDREYITTAGRFNQDAPTSGEWEWDTIARTVGPYQNWRAGHPHADIDHCIVLVGSGSAYKWESKACAIERKFICEINI